MREFVDLLKNNPDFFRIPEKQQLRSHSEILQHIQDAKNEKSSKAMEA